MSASLPYSARPSNGRRTPTRLNVFARKTTATWLLAAALLVLVLPTASRGQAIDGGTPAPAGPSGSAGSAAPAEAGGAASATGAPATGSPAAAEVKGAPETPDGGTPGAGARADVPVPSDSDVITEVRIEGNRRVEPEVVKRALKNKLGHPFDPSLTGADLQSLWSLGYFQDIQLLTQRLPTGGIVYVVRVSERPSIREWRLQGAEELNKEDFKDTIDLKPYAILDLDAVRRNVKKSRRSTSRRGSSSPRSPTRLSPSRGPTRPTWCSSSTSTPRSW